jgi:hypothetical protein
LQNNTSALGLALLLGGGLSKSSKLKVLAVADAAVGWLLWLCGLVRLRSEGLRIPRRPKSERGQPGWGLGTTTTVPPAAAANCSRTEGGRECELQPVETTDK